jgi:hypothetical protein
MNIVMGVTELQIKSVSRSWPQPDKSMSSAFGWQRDQLDQ